MFIDSSDTVEEVVLVARWMPDDGKEWAVGQPRPQGEWVVHVNTDGDDEDDM